MSDTANQTDAAFLDTSVVIRYLMQDDPMFSERSRRIVDGSRELLLTGATIAETAYVLVSVYKLQCEPLVDSLIALIQRQNIRLYALDKPTVIQSLLFCRPSGRISYADALLWASARSSGINAVYSFDERFPSIAIRVRGGSEGEENKNE